MEPDSIKQRGPLRRGPYNTLCILHLADNWIRCKCNIGSRDQDFRLLPSQRNASLTDHRVCLLLVFSPLGTVNPEILLAQCPSFNQECARYPQPSLVHERTFLGIWRCGLKHSFAQQDQKPMPLLPQLVL